MVKNWGDVEFEKTNFLLGQKKESLGRKMKILGRKMKPNKRKKIIWTLRFRKKSYFLLSTRIIKITHRNWVHTQIFSSLYFCNLVMVFTFNTFKLKLFDLIDFIGWTIKGYTTSSCKDLGIETSEFVTVELNSFLVCCFIHCYLQGWDLIQLFLKFLIYFL